MAKKSILYSDTPIGKMEDNFYRFNILGEGRERGAATDSQWWRKDVRFYGEGAICRYMGRLPNTKTPAFIYTFNGEPDNELLNLWYAKAFEVPHYSLGVFSRFENDCISVEATHERVRFLMLSEIREFVMEKLPRITGDKLTPHEEQYTKSGDETWLSKRARTGKDVMDRQGIGPMSDWLLEKIARYNMYSAAFALSWPDVPPMYREQFERVAQKKLDAYTSPKAVAQRERAAARKLAEKALDIKREKR